MSLWATIEDNWKDYKRVLSFSYLKGSIKKVEVSGYFIKQYLKYEGFKEKVQRMF